VSLLHLVCFKYAADVGIAAHDDHRARLAALNDIDGMTSLKVGGDDPRHVPVAQYGASIVDHIVAVDFEIQRVPRFPIPDIKLSASASVYCRQDADCCGRRRVHRQRHGRV
jgi:hypothetical protein